MNRFNLKFIVYKFSNRINFLILILVSIIYSGNAQTIPAGFNLVAYEGFNYSSGSSLLNASGGSGWSTGWSKSYMDRYLKTATTGFTYTGLTTTGLKAEFSSTCNGTCNDIASLGRSFPLQNEGVVYFQFISIFEASPGGGTPTIRFFDGATQTGGIGSSSGSNMSILAASLANLSSSSASLSAQNLVVVRIDYNLNKTEMWINPNLATFDYSNPTSPSASATGFAPTMDRLDIFIRSGSIDEITVFSKTSAPTGISGVTAICNGNNTTLTSNGGSTGSNVVDVWYSGSCGDEAFHQGWDTQPYSTLATTVNSNLDGILNVTSSSSDPGIAMYNLGSFDPTVNKYINVRYRVTSGTAGAAQIFFLNSAITVPNGGYYKDVSLISDNAWHIATLDMSSHANWTDSNITGWRFDYATVSGVTMDIDFIELGASSITGTGTSITVSPTSNSTYYVKRKGSKANTTCASQLVTVNSLPTPTFTAQPGVTTATNSNVSYSTEASQTNYVWTIPGVLNTDYSITSGGTTADNTVVLKWLTEGNKTITVNYTNSNNCSAAIAISSILTNVFYPILTKNGAVTENYSNATNKNGIVGYGNGLTKNGKITIVNNGLTAATAATSAYQIKQVYPSSTDGVYWITNTNINGGVPFQIYADMTTDGGGWMLLNVGAGDIAAPEASTLTAPNILGYLPRATVIELASLCTEVQLRAGASYSSYANKTTSTSPLAIGALKSTANDVNGAATWANGSSTTFVVNSGTWQWAYCCPGIASGWPKMYHSSNYTNGVHWFADLGIGRKNSTPRDAWFSTWIR